MKYLAVSILVVLCLSCSTMQEDTLENTVWEAYRYKYSGEKVYKVTLNDYSVSFDIDIVNVVWDVNGCSMSYTYDGYGSIQIDLLGCTKACCDSPFAENASELISSATRYTLTKSKLKLSGDKGVVYLVKR